MTLILNFSQGERFGKAFSSTSFLSGQFAIGVCLKKQVNLATTKGFAQRDNTSRLVLTRRSVTPKKERKRFLLFS